VSSRKKCSTNDTWPISAFDRSRPRTTIVCSSEVQMAVRGTVTLPIFMAMTAPATAPSAQDGSRSSPSGRAWSSRDRPGPCRADGPEPVAAFRIGTESAAGLHHGLGGELHVVLAVAVTGPDVEQRAGERLAVEIGDAAHVERRLAGHAFADVAAQRQVRRTGPV